MKKLFARILILLLLLIVSDFIIGAFLKQVLKHSPDGRYYKANVSLNESKDDVVIFGSSRAETNYAPYIFEDTLNFTCWNTGRGGQKLPFWYAMSKGILKRYTPKIAVINIEDDFLSEDLSSAYEHTGLLRPFYYDNPEIRPVINNISRFERFLMLSKVYAYNSSFYYLFRPYLIKGLDGKLEDKGWKTRKGVIPATYTTNFKQVKSKNKLNQQTVDLFEEFIKGFTDKGCQVYVFISPDYRSIIESTSTIEYIKNMENINFMNLGDDTSFSNNKSYFIDPSHLNINGAIEFSKKVSSAIVKNKKEKSPLNNRAEQYVFNNSSNIKNK